MSDKVDVVVVGGGVIGCACASVLARAGRSVFLLEAGPRLAEGVTSRNSGVIHSGLYYPAGSLKAVACVRGQELLYRWVADHGVWHRACGKLVIARGEGQRAELEKLHKRAQDNGAPGVELVGRDRIRALEPLIDADVAMWCPRTGIVDPVEFAQSLADDARAHDAAVLMEARVEHCERANDGWRLHTSRGEMDAVRVVNAAGLHADEVAQRAGLAVAPVHPCRGDYFRMRTRAPWSRLVYPVKEPRSPGLGVHLVLDRTGSVRLGPDTTWVDRKDVFSGGEEKRAAFAEAASRLFGRTVAPEELEHDGCGIRPKLRAPHESDEKDFVISEDAPGFINLLGIESPGLTAALELAERVGAMCA